MIDTLPGLNPGLYITLVILELVVLDNRGTAIADEKDTKRASLDSVADNCRRAAINDDSYIARNGTEVIITNSRGSSVHIYCLVASIRNLVVLDYRRVSTTANASGANMPQDIMT